jgi:hypothetical protein
MDIGQLAQQATASTIATAKINWMLYMGAVAGAAVSVLGGLWYLYVNTQATKADH